MANVHPGTLVLACGTPGVSVFDGRMRTEEGFVYDVPGGFTQPKLPSMPASLRIEQLREDGAPVVVTDNTKAIHDALGPYAVDKPYASGGGGACAVDTGRGGGRSAALLSLFFAGLALAGTRVRRRR